MTSSDKKIANRIQKMIDMAQSTNHEGEAAVLMGQIRRLMDKHNMSEIDLVKLREEDPLGVNAPEFSHRVNDSWMFELTSIMAQYYGGHVVRFNCRVSKHTRYISVVGPESTRAVMSYMVPYVRKEILTRGRKLFLETDTYKSLNAARRSLANAMIKRIQKMYWERQTDLTGVAKKNELVVVDAVEAFMHEAFDDLDMKKTVEIKTHWDSVKEAEKVGLDLQMSENQKETTLRIGG